MTESITALGPVADTQLLQFSCHLWSAIVTWTGPMLVADRRQEYHVSPLPVRRSRSSTPITRHAGAFEIRPRQSPGNKKPLWVAGLTAPVRIY